MNKIKKLKIVKFIKNNPLLVSYFVDKSFFYYFKFIEK